MWLYIILSKKIIKILNKYSILIRILLFPCLESIQIILKSIQIYYTK